MWVNVVYTLIVSAKREGQRDRKQRELETTTNKNSDTNRQKVQRRKESQEDK